MSLRRIGRLIAADGQGVLPRQGQAIKPVWQPVFQDLTAQLQSYFGANLISVGARGSVARQTDVDSVSDLDAVVFLNTPQAAELRLVATQMPDLKIDVAHVSKHDFLTHDRHGWLRFALAFSGVTVWGGDILGGLPEPQLGRHAVAHLKGVDKWHGCWVTFWDECSTDAERRLICQWLMKRIMRSLFETQMCDLNAYSRDTYPCMMVAITAFPDHETAIRQAATLAVAPTHHKPDVAAVVDALLATLLAEQRKFKTQ